MPGEQLTKNPYKPHHLLLGSVYLRLAHCLMLLAADCPSTAAPPSARYIPRGLKACEEGMEAARSSASSDPSLIAELKFHHGELVAHLEYHIAGLFTGEMFRESLALALYILRIAFSN